MRFDRLLAPSSINRTQLRLTTGGLQAFAGLRYDPIDRSLSLYPSANDLRPGLEYVFTVDVGLRGWEGSAMSHPIEVRFRPTVRVDVAPPRDVSLRLEVAPLLAARCTGSGCHGGDDPAMGLDLSTADAIRTTAVGVLARERGGRAFLETLDPRWSTLPRVDPGITAGQGRPEYSYVIYKLLGDGPIWGARMPRGGVALSDEETRLVADWIAAGAPDS